jgi:hypothetical protein
MVPRGGEGGTTTLKLECKTTQLSRHYSARKDLSRSGSDNDGQPATTGVRICVCDLA